MKYPEYRNYPLSIAHSRLFNNSRIFHGQTDNFHARAGQKKIPQNGIF
jgi:hypothetical protein